MESALYGIFTLAGFVSEISLVRCAHSFDFRYFTNSCENPVRTRFPWSNLYILIIVTVCGCVMLQLDLSSLSASQTLNELWAMRIVKTCIIAVRSNSSAKSASLCSVILNWYNKLWVGMKCSIQVTLCPIDSQNGLFAMVTTSLSPLTWVGTSFRVLWPAALKRSKDLF